MTKIHVFRENQKVPLKIEEEYSLRHLNLPVNKNNTLSLDFVGIIIKRNHHPLIVFPKHFPIEKTTLQKDIQLLIRVLQKIKKVKRFDEKEEDTSFPLNSYLYVCQYYRKFGLYMEQERIIKAGYNGKINWKQTIKKGNKILNQGNIVFIPFMIDRKIDQSVFITMCMEEVLAHGYEHFAKYFNLGIKYSINRNFFNKPQVQHIIKQLKLLKNKYFKDSTKKLIQELIQYFEWVGTTGDKVSFLTTNFEFVWEDMVHHFLNNHFNGMDISKIPHRIIWDSSKSQTYHFIRKQTNFVKQDDHIERNYSVEYDHIAFDKNNKNIYLMDSKYYENINGLNYKQFVYSHLILEEQMSYGTESNKMNLISGLILPTEKEYFSKIHINRMSIDRIYITEHYFNVRELMIDYIY